MSDSVEILNMIRGGSACDLDETDYTYTYLSVNPSNEEAVVDDSEIDPEFKASSLLIALNTTEDINPNADTCLVVNKTLQDVVSDLLRIVTDEIKQLQIYKQQILKPSTLSTSQQLMDLSQNETSMETGTAEPELVHKQQFLQARHHPIRCPYFQSHKFSIPHDNEDTELRRKRGEFNMPEFTPLRWLKADNQKLIRAVVDDFRRRMIGNLERELTKKIEEYNHWLIVGPKSKELSGQIGQIKQEIANIKKTPDSAFIDRVMTPNNVEDVDWLKISVSDFGGSVSDRNLKLIWMHHFNKSNNYNCWTEAEDKALKQAVEELGLHSWEEVAAKLQTNRTAFMCIQRYQQYLSPTIAVSNPMSTDEIDVDIGGNTELKSLCHLFKRPWTPEDDKRLKELVELATDDQKVIHWRFVVNQLEGRRLNACITRWNKINPNSKKGPFSEMEDLQLLLAVQRHGAENFALVAGTALPNRSQKDCRQRYRELISDLTREWTYEEDRKLYLLMQEVEKSLQKRGIQEGKSYNKIPTRCFKDLLVHLPGRTWQNIQRRYQTLQTWKSSYETLRQSVLNETSVVNEQGTSQSSYDMRPSKVSEKRWKKDEVRALFMRTPFMLNLLEKLKGAGVKTVDKLHDVFSEDSKVTRSNKKTTAINSDALIPGSELSSMLKDASEGIVVPRPCPKIEWCSILRHTRKKIMLESKVREELERMLAEEQNQLITNGKDIKIAINRRCRIIQVLLNDNDQFWLALEQAVRHPMVSSRFQELTTARDFIDAVPIIVRRMMSDAAKLLMNQKQGALTQNEVDEKSDQVGLIGRLNLDEGPVKTNRVSKFNNIILFNKINRCGQIYFQMRKDDNLRRLTSWKSCPIKSFIPQTIDERIGYEDGRRKIYGLLSRSLHYDINSLDNSRLEEIREHGVALSNLPPNLCTIGAFKTLLIHRGQLIRAGDKDMEIIMQARRLAYCQGYSRENVGDAVQALKKMRRGGLRESQKRTVEYDASSSEIVARQNLLNDPRYLLLRARMYALFFWPALLSTSNVEEYYSDIEQANFRSDLISSSSTQNNESTVNPPPITTKRPSSKGIKYKLRTSKTFRYFHERFAVCSRVRKTKKFENSFGNSSRKRSATDLPVGERSLRSKRARIPDIISVELSSEKQVILPKAVHDLISDGFVIDSYISSSCSVSNSNSELTSEFPYSNQMKRELIE